MNLAEINAAQSPTTPASPTMPKPWYISAQTPTGFVVFAHTDTPMECVMLRPNEFAVQPIAVPEPSGLLLAGVLVLAVLGRGRG